MLGAGRATAAGGRSALREPRHAARPAGVPMSTADTGALTLAALRRLRTAACAADPSCATSTPPPTRVAVAAQCPGGRFARPRSGPTCRSRRRVTAPLALYGAALRRAGRGEAAPLRLVARRDGATWTRRPIGRRRAPLVGPACGRATGRCCDRCAGPTLDVGLRPGPARGRARPAPAATRSGVDICAEAVRQARRRGAAALRGDVFAPLPGEGGWRSVLLADGNIGIGGDPDRLLRRCARRCCRRGGAILVEVDPPGADQLAGAGGAAAPRRGRARPSRGPRSAADDVAAGASPGRAAGAASCGRRRTGGSPS